MADGKVLVVMGSDSDLPVVAETLKIFDKFGIKYSVNIASAHRTAEFVKQCVNNAVTNGAKTFIAVAGMSVGCTSRGFAYGLSPSLQTMYKGQRVHPVHHCKFLMTYLQRDSGNQPLAQQVPS